MEFISPYDLLINERLIFLVFFAAGIALGGWYVAGIESKKREIKAFINAENVEVKEVKNKEGWLSELLIRSGMFGQEVNILLAILAISVVAWLFGYSLTGVKKLAFIFVLIGPFVIWMYLNGKADKNDWIMYRQTGDLCHLMSNAVNSGATVENALPKVANKMESPLKEHMTEASRRVMKGEPVVDVLRDMCKYVRVSPFYLFVKTTAVGKKRGGDLSEAYADIYNMVSKSIEAIHKVRLVKEASIRRGAIVTAVPFGMIFFLRAWAPDYVAPLFNTTPGYFFLGVVGALVLGAWVLIRKFSRLELV